MTYCRMSCLLMDWKRRTLTALHVSSKKHQGQSMRYRAQRPLQHSGASVYKHLPPGLDTTTTSPRRAAAVFAGLLHALLTWCDYKSSTIC